MKIYDETLKMNRSLAGTFAGLRDVVPDDAADLPETAVKLYVETAGAVRLMPLDGTGPITVQLPDFSELPLNVSRVYASGTTAAGIKAFVI
ncbi:hypothetical protein N6L24_09490 [Cognatishimia sp. SS12]|uniref:spike base protein, RCAP_Rcc01079 family n=1 Tax=Cognatishimia sp. SS12 TaxID=2979465 RepID=UPI00232DE27F|nr:hypothetical protein [Cognatishimia sp. SS12]MDC0738513.1 hypothetical protein [Cognatishimia sp. SS12]